MSMLHILSWSLEEARVLLLVEWRIVIDARIYLAWRRACTGKADDSNYIISSVPLLVQIELLLL
jgi:hypothetical protein